MAESPVQMSIKTTDLAQNAIAQVISTDTRVTELNRLWQWLAELDPDKHYCGFELDFGMERQAIGDYIDQRIEALTGVKVDRQLPYKSKEA